MVCKDPRSTVCCFWSILNTKFSTLAYFYGLNRLVVTDRTLFKVRCPMIRSQIQGAQVRLPKDEHVRVCLMFEKRKFCWMSNFVNLVKAQLGLMFDVQCQFFRSQAKNRVFCSGQITSRRTSLNSFYVKKIVFKFLRCSIKWCLTHHYRLDKKYVI